MRCAIVPKPVPGSTSEAPRSSEHPTEARCDAPSSQNQARDRLARRRASPSTLRKPRARRHRPKTCPAIDFRGAAPFHAPYGSPGRGAIVHERVPSSTFGSLRPFARPTEAMGEAPSSTNVFRVRLSDRCAPRSSQRRPREPAFGRAAAITLTAGPPSATPVHAQRQAKSQRGSRSGPRYSNPVRLWRRPKLRISCPRARVRRRDCCPARSECIRGACRFVRRPANGPCLCASRAGCRLCGRVPGRSL